MYLWKFCLSLTHCISCFWENVFEYRHQVKDFLLFVFTSMEAEAVLHILNLESFCVNHLFSVFVAWCSYSFESWHTGNKCINNVVSKMIKSQSINQGSRAVDTIQKTKSFFSLAAFGFKLKSALGLLLKGSIHYTLLIFITQLC